MLKGADLVFVIAINSNARDKDEIALALSVQNYEANSTSLEKLREVAIWQGDGHYKRGKRTGLAMATMGYSGFFSGSVAKGLVKQFHKERKLLNCGV
ncbi:MAG TPA: hypothetical protein VOA41_11415 [Candidatus Dormibacteraeota bacterium]|nr:hypothetical protein [Candidatus Dormibacteraeota bacterium]